MRINDIICEDFWQLVDSLDKQYNPEAHSYRTQEDEKSGEVSVVTQIKDDQPKFTNRRKEDRIPSNGWVGKVRAKYHAGHITKEQYEKLLNLS